MEKNEEVKRRKNRLYTGIYTLLLVVEIVALLAVMVEAPCMTMTGEVATATTFAVFFIFWEDSLRNAFDRIRKTTTP